jgi:hypothetical protein
MEQLIELFRKNKLKKLMFVMSEDDGKIVFNITACDRDDLNQNIGITEYIDANTFNEEHEAVATSMVIKFPMLQRRLDRRKLEIQE